MRTASGPLVTLLNSGQTLVWADLYTITLLGGTVLRYTNADHAITYNSTTWPIGPGLTRSTTKLVVGITVDTMELTITATDSIQINGMPLLRFIAAGGLDGARVKLERIYASSWAAAPAGTIMPFEGRVSEMNMDRFEARLTVVSDLELLDAKVPKNLYQPGCMNTLYDAPCGKSKTALSVSNAVTSSPTPTKSVFDTTLAQATDYFSLGVVRFTSGQNNGVARTIRKFDSGGLVTLIAPLPFVPAAGDTFTIYPGCDKTLTTCTSRFGNQARFRGVPFIPVPETIT